MVCGDAEAGAARYGDGKNGNMEEGIEIFGKRIGLRGESKAFVPECWLEGKQRVGRWLEGNVVDFWHWVIRIVTSQQLYIVKLQHDSIRSLQVRPWLRVFDEFFPCRWFLI